MTSNDKKWFGISRAEIDWHPIIDEAKCTACLACVKKCSHGVFVERGGRPVVVNPQNCVVGCIGCQKVCLTGAISHSPKEYLKKLVNHKDFRAGCSCGDNSCQEA